MLPTMNLEGPTGVTRGNGEDWGGLGLPRKKAGVTWFVWLGRGRGGGETCHWVVGGQKRPREPVAWWRIVVTTLEHVGDLVRRKE